MTKILDEILKNLPEKAKISDASFEAANIVLYTKNKDFFFDDQGLIREIVNNIKKRIELRPDPSLCMDMEKAKILIEKIVPAESLTSNVIFDPQRSRVIIESEKPGLAIGKQGEILKEIKKQTLWVPTVRRTPAIRSKIIDNIRQVLYEESEYRKKFLNKVGHRIYDGWIREKKHEWVRLGYLGAAREVGRSCLFLQTPESRVLLDCGLNPAANSDDQMYPYLDAPEFKIEDLDAVIVSHSHLDHCGLVPFLYKMGYRGPVYCTAPTRDIAALLALDYIEVAFKEAKKSIYTSTDIKEMVKHTICLDYEEVSDITPDIRLTFYNAGHTIGSAMSHLHIGNGLHNWLYTGDLKFGRTQLLESASVDFPRLETVSIESTYGGKEDTMPARHECEAQILKIVKDTIERKGKVLMPVLGVGRSQEVLLIIENAIRNKLLEKIPVYIHGMVWDITAIHTAYPDFLSKNIRKSIFHKDENPFLSDIFLRVGSRKEQDEIINEKGPCVIMATSGMMTGGPSVEYFKSLAENPKNSLVLTCYQGEGSLGRRIQQGEKTFTFANGEKTEQFKMGMEVHTINGLSGHSSRQELIRFIYSLNPRPKRIIVNHGESSKCLDLASSLHKINKIETSAPRNLEIIRIK